MALSDVQTESVVHCRAAEVVGNEGQPQTIGVVTAMGQGSHDMVDLVDVLLEANVKRLTAGERLPTEPGLSRRTLSEMLLAQATDFRPRRRPHYA